MIRVIRKSNNMILWLICKVASLTSSLANKSNLLWREWQRLCFIVNGMNARLELNKEGENI